MIELLVEGDHGAQTRYALPSTQNKHTGKGGRRPTTARKVQCSSSSSSRHRHAGVRAASAGQPLPPGGTSNAATPPQSPRKKNHCQSLSQRQAALAMAKAAARARQTLQQRPECCQRCPWSRHRQRRDRHHRWCPCACHLCQALCLWMQVPRLRSDRLWRGQARRLAY